MSKATAVDILAGIIVAERKRSARLEAEAFKLRNDLQSTLRGLEQAACARRNADRRVAEWPTIESLTEMLANAIRERDEARTLLNAPPGRRTDDHRTV